jgi:phosphoribosylcarboxyaminoimidazole (NCAIR) mutase
VDILELETAPKDVQAAANACLLAMQLGVTPDRELVNYVQVWLGKQQAQNKWGK